MEKDIHDSAATTRLAKAFERTSTDSPESVALYIRAVCETSRAGVESKPTVSEEHALILWAREFNKVISPGFFEESAKRDEIALRAEEFEHVVYHDPRNDLAIKLTRPGTFGMIRGTLDYFDRLDFCNHIFGDDCRVLGLIFGEGDRFQVVTSQPWIPEDEDPEDPTLDEIEAYFEALKFRMFWLGPENPGFYREDLDLVARDAHEGNFIRSRGKLVPIDVILEHPSPEQRETIANQLGS